MPIRLLTCVLGLSLCAWTAAPTKVQDLVAIVRNDLKARRADAEIAKEVRQAKLGERLDFAVIEEMQSEGAGPETLEELDRQRGLTAKLAAPSLHLFEEPAAPSSQEQADAIEQARAGALQYTAKLPNFLCTEMVHRYEASKGSQNWKAQDVLKVDLTYSEKGERYRLLETNGRPASRPLENSGDFWSSGEFGSLLKFIFHPDAAARFQWERWANLRGRPTLVFSYRIEQSHSGYQVGWNEHGKKYHMTAGIIGMVYIDPETHAVMRFLHEASEIPSDWPIVRTPGMVDYDYADVGGQRFLLPKRADSRVVLKNGEQRNVVEFTNYRKFTGEARVTFDK
jgi:hypothetical protein